MSEFSDTLNLSFDSLIQVRVSATNSIGNSIYSVVNTIGARVRSVPNQMESPTLGTDITETQLDIRWNALTGASSGNSDIISYQLFWDA